MRFVTVVTNNEGGCPARIHESLTAARDWVRAYLTDPEIEPPQTEGERRAMEHDLSGCDGESVCQIRGSEACKEWVYLAPVKE